MISIKSKREIELMRVANQIVAEALKLASETAKAGMTTAELDRIVEDYIVKNGAKPAFKGYYGFPATCCISINEKVVHGIPSDKEIIKEGDIVSVDVGSIYKGYYGDSALTIPIGNISEEAKKLLEVTEKCLYIGIKRAIPGNKVHDISFAIQQYAEWNGMGVVREYTGHGIGTNLHEKPDVPNWGTPGTGVLLKEGMTIAIEPMINLGTYKVKVLNDGWTVVTADGKLSAHFEHTIAITANGPDILSRRD